MKTQSKKQLKKLAQELAKEIKSQDDLSTITSEFMKMTLEAALEGEMAHHLGYDKHGSSPPNQGNYRNGHYSKKVKGNHGEIDIDVPRDRQSEFDPLIIEKGQSRVSKFDDQILSLYAKGMTTRDIMDTFAQMYGVDISASLVSKVTDSVLDKALSWRTRDLDEVYPIVYFDGLVVKVREDNRVIKKTIYIALGINLEGRKECLGLWIAKTESAKFWLSVMNDLRDRQLKDIFVACVDGLTGFPDAINTVYPKTDIQLCIVHLVRNSLKFVSYKDKKQVAENLKKIYRAKNEEQALRALEQFEQKYQHQFPYIAKSWRDHWDNIITIFQYPSDIRKAIYTTNAIESLNSVIRKYIKNHKIFAHDNSAMKMIYLSIDMASRKWTMPIHNWTMAMNQFMIMHQDRIPKQF